MQFLRYTAAGATATLVHYALLLALVEALRWPVARAAALGALAGAAVAYLLNRRVTFSVPVPHRQALPRFAAVAVLGALLNGAIVGSAIRWGAHYLAAQVAATLAVLLLTFQLNKTWSFR